MWFGEIGVISTITGHTCAIMPTKDITAGTPVIAVRSTPMAQSSEHDTKHKTIYNLHMDQAKARHIARSTGNIADTFITRHGKIIRGHTTSPDLEWGVFNFHPPYEMLFADHEDYLSFLVRRTETKEEEQEHA